MRVGELQPPARTIGIGATWYAAGAVNWMMVINERAGWRESAAGENHM